MDIITNLKARTKIEFKKFYKLVYQKKNKSKLKVNATTTNNENVLL